MNATLKQTTLAAMLGFLLPAAQALQPGDVPEPTQQALSSYQRIGQALAAGQIDEETAYRYRVFAAFGDARLPESYRGDDNAITEPPSSVLEAGSLLPGFTPQTRAELAPYFMTPAAPGSWVELRAGAAASSNRTPGDAVADAQPLDGAEAHEDAASRPPSSRAIQWHTVTAAAGKVKVWAQMQHAGDSAKAEEIGRQMTSTIWPRLVPVLGPPKSDMNDPNNSGGPELDIFLVRPSESTQERLAQRPGAWAGLAMYADPQKCQDAAFFLLVNSRMPLGSATSQGLLQTVAHEFAHALTGAKPLMRGCAAYDWMREATATWAEHKAYPEAQSEITGAQAFFEDVSITLDTSTPGDANAHAYNSYLFPLYLQLDNSEGAIPKIWGQFSGKDLREGIEAGLKAHGLKFEEVFPKFAVQNLNQASADLYTRLDRLPFKPDIPDSHDVTLPPGSVDYEKPIDLRIEDLATHYTRFVFDQTVQMVTLENTLVPLGYAGVWVLTKQGINWDDPVDVTKEHVKTWCRDHPREDISELIIVFTNNEWRDETRLVEPGSHYRPMLRAYPEGCGRGWTGTTRMVNTLISQDPAITIVETISTTMRFDVDPALAIAGQPREHFRTVGGHISWRAQVTGECSGGASGSVSIRNVPDEDVATLRIWAENGMRHHSGSGSWPGDIPRYTIVCRNETSELTLLGALGFFVTDFDKDGVGPDGRSFSGHFVLRSLAPAITTEHQYSFRCNRSC